MPDESKYDASHAVLPSATPSPPVWGASDDPAAAKIAANDGPTHEHTTMPVAAANDIPVVAAVEVPAQHAIPRGHRGSEQVVCADWALRGSSGVLLLVSSISFCVGVTVANNTADLWRGVLAVWGAAPQILYASLAATALVSQCRCEHRSHAYCAGFACLIPLCFSFFSLTTASAHTRALDRLEGCTSSPAYSWALGKEASRKIHFNPQYLRKEASHEWYQGYCRTDADCDGTFPLKPERRDFYEKKFCLPLNDTAAGRAAMSAHPGHTGICAAQCAETCNCYKTNADTKGDDKATYSACWEFSNWNGDCDDLLDTLKQQSDTHAVFTSLTLVSGIAFVNCLFLAACIRPLVGTRIHFEGPPVPQAPAIEMQPVSQA